MTRKHSRPLIRTMTRPHPLAAALAFSLLCFSLLLAASAARAVTVTDTTPTSATFTGSAWTNPNNALSQDNNSATWVNSDQSYLVLKGFDFSSIPDSATISGITVRVRGMHSSGTASYRDYKVGLTKNGTAVVGSTKDSSVVGTTLGTTMGDYNLGNSSDLWGTTWTAAEIKNANFGVMLTDNDTTATGTSPGYSIDVMYITVDYTCTPTGSLSITAGQTLYGNPIDLTSISSASNASSLEYTVTGGSGTCSIDDSGTYIEAEDFSASSSYTGGYFTEVTDGTVNGGKYMRSDGTANTTSESGQQRLDYQVDFTSTGTFKIWIRGYALDGTSDSIYIGLNGTMVGALNENATYNTWVWTNSIQTGVNTINVPTTGTHTINVWVRETAHRLDGIYITKGAETPSGGIPSGATEIDPASGCATTLFTGNAASAASVDTSGWTDGGTFTLQLTGDDATCGTPLAPASDTFTWIDNSLTVGDGTDPANATVAPGSGIVDLDSFTLQTIQGTDTVTALTVNLATTTGVDTISITSDGGGTVYGTAAPAAQPQEISLSTNITATTTLTQYKVRITPQAHADQPAVPGSTYAVSGTVTAVASSLGKVYSDTDSATITIDNQSPSDPTGLSATPDTDSVPLSWTNPGADFSSVVLLRRTGSAVADTPVEGTAYSASDTIGDSTVVYAGSGTSFDDTGVAYGNDYYYKIFAKDAYGNYSTPGLAAGPYATTCLDASPTTTVTVSSTTVNGAAVDLSALFSVDVGSNAGSPAYKINGADVTSPWDSTGFGSPSAENVTLQVTVTDPDCGTGYDVVGSNTITVDNRLDAITVAAVSVTASAFDQIDVSWPYTHDKNNDGAASYRYRTSAGPGAWSAPAAMTKGASAFTVSITGLSENTGYDVEVTVTDGDGITGSNPQTGSATTPVEDGGAPATVTDLAVLSEPSIGSYYLTLQWTAPGDDPDQSGSAASYDVRYSKKPIVESGATAGQTNWADATVAENLPAPQEGGSTEYAFVFGLEPNSTYYFALKATDDMAQTSAISNNPAITFTPTAVTSPPYDPVGAAYGKTSLEKGWNLVSTPLTPSPNTASAVFGDDAAYNWMFHYDSTWDGVGTEDDAISEDDYSQAATIAAGKAVMMYSMASNRATDATGSEVVADPYTVSLTRGWNLVGNPYLRPVNLSDCTVDDGVTTYSSQVGIKVGNALHDWNGSSYVSTLWSSAVLEPWKGYWLFAHQNATLYFHKP